MSVLIVSKDKASLALKVGQTPAGARGLTGEQGVQGEQGDAFVYSDFTSEQLTALKGEQGDPVPITTALGQSSTQAVSQKLLTGEVDKMNKALGDISLALTQINGV